MHRLLANCVLLATVAAQPTMQASDTTSTPSTTGSTPTTTLPPGYKYHAATGSAYKLHESEVSWYVANATCGGEGGHLTVLNDEVEADIVARIVRDIGGLYWTWIGLHDNRPGGVMEWRTVLGEPLSDVYHEWGGGHPNNGELYTCAHFGAYNKLLYNYWTCDSKHYFTCERAQ